MKKTSSFDFVQLRGAIASGSVEIPPTVAMAMEKPIDFPSIDRALVPGDRVAIAVHDSLPQASLVVQSLIDWLFNHPALSDLRLSVVLANGQDTLAEQITSWLSDKYPESTQGDEPQCSVVCHDPDDPHSLEYIAASDQAEAIYLHRELVEADFVIPVYRWLEPHDPRSHDPYMVLPTFGDRATLNRYAKAWLRHSDAGAQSSMSIAESGWLAGIQFAIGALANQEGQIAMLVSGTPAGVDRACQEGLGTSPQAEKTSPEKGFDLVVVELVDESGAPNWRQIAGAACSAERWLSPAGRIVVVASKLSVVSPGIGALASDDPDEEIQQVLLDSQLEDAFSAAVLRGIQSRRSIYVQSQVDPEILESLGFASIRNPSELERLIHKASRVGVMEY